MYQSAKELANKARQRIGRTIDNATGRVVAASTGLALATGSARAAGPDFSTLTSSIDLSTVGIAILAIAGIMAGVYVTIKGAKIVIGMLKSA